MGDAERSPEALISLPRGGGAIRGMGETFSPDLQTGTGNLTVPIVVPEGRGALDPKLALSYSSGAGNGHFGLGWSLSVPGISRRTSHGVPRYDDTDTFLLAAGEELVRWKALPPTVVRYRPRTEGPFAKIVRHYDRAGDADYWEVTTTDGLISRYGTSPSKLATGTPDPSTTVDPDDGDKVFAWRLTETRDTFGNVVAYVYDADAGDVGGHRWSQPLLRSIRYVDHTSGDGSVRFAATVDFEYEERDDAFSSYASGFEVRFARRCRTITMAMHVPERRPVRRYELAYGRDEHTGVSLLEAIQVVGFDDAGVAQQDLPALRFGYTGFRPEGRQFKAVSGAEPPVASLGRAGYELVDLTGNGLPDVLELDGTARYWRNLGGGGLDRPRPMPTAPGGLRLGDPGVQLLDADGDGRADLVVKGPNLAGYFPLRFGATWRGFRGYRESPSFEFEDAAVRLVDLDGNGVTDVLRSDARLWCSFSDEDAGWTGLRPARFAEGDGSANLDLADRRVRVADMSGDGLRDLVLVHDARIEYWPNLGHGRFGRRLRMASSPRLPRGHDPRRVLLGDLDGDGAADLVYVGDGETLVWINRSGNGWSEPITIRGTPSFGPGDDVRITDLLGTGVGGVLWSRDAPGQGRPSLLFLDLAGAGAGKPRLLDRIDNQLGALTRVRYAPSTRFWLQDEAVPATRWRTPLPFVVPVVASTETIDQISRSKLTSELRYRHGYWDGVDREFRGFGCVEQRDTQTFEAYHADATLRPVPRPSYMPPTLTRRWFHLGPVESEDGDWRALNHAGEHWPGDPDVLGHDERTRRFLATLSDRRARRDALRTLRGRVLRTELFALDGSAREGRPYTVTEHAHGLREEPSAGGRVFFPHTVAERTTVWERGDDPMTRFSFTGDHDAFGQPRRQTTVAMPRRSARRTTLTAAVVGTVSPDPATVVATHTRTTFASPSADVFLHDRVAQVRRYELADPSGVTERDPGDVRAVLADQATAAETVRAAFETLDPGDVRLTGHTAHHYDGPAFEGLAAEQLGQHGALVRSEALFFTDGLLDDAFGVWRPSHLGGPDAQLPGTPPGFGDDHGYRREAAGPAHEAGWYADTLRRAYDFQAGLGARGLIVATQDPTGAQADVGYDAFALAPLVVRDAAGLETVAEHDYRAGRPRRVVDPNGHATNHRYDALGRLRAMWLEGRDGEGGSGSLPELSHDYDFGAYARERQPIHVHTRRRVQHGAPAVIESREYSDGFGRLLQRRAQADDLAFGDAGDDVGLGGAGRAATTFGGRRLADRVVVSGWQVYDNKGSVVERYEPFHARGWAFQPEAEARQGRAVSSVYDACGRVVRVLNPDGSERRTVFGVPADLTEPDLVDPTPWAVTSYDENDLAPSSTAPDGSSLADAAPAAHHFTPTTAILDALGHTICQLERAGPEPARDWHLTRTAFDARGNVVAVTDQHGRRAFEHVHDLADRPLRIEGLDAGRRMSLVDARGNIVEAAGGPRAERQWTSLRIYDRLGRLARVYARDRAGQRLTLREQVSHGDGGDPGQPAAERAAARTANRLGRVWRHHDEAGVATIDAYDFQGNVIEHVRQVVGDDAIAGADAAGGFTMDWAAAGAEAALDATPYRTTTRYDALNRITRLIAPAGVDGHRAETTPSYGPSGALRAVAVDGADVVTLTAYDARGRRVLAAYGNGLVTRHAYDPNTSRLTRLRTERATAAGDDWTTQDPALQELSYAHDLVGNVTRIDEETPGCGIAGGLEGRDRLVRTFTYDAIYRLTEATGRACADIARPRPLADQARCGFDVPYTPRSATPNQANAPDLTEGYTERYAYDPAGNLLDLTHVTGGATWHRRFGIGGRPPDEWADAAGNRLTSVIAGSETRALVYDDGGNLVAENADRTYTWDHAGRLVGFRVASGGVASQSARYLCGADGARVKKWVRRGATAALDESVVYIGNVAEHHRWAKAGGGANSLLHVVDDTGRVALLRRGEPHPDATGPAVRYELADHLGGASLSVDAAGAWMCREEYFPFGETSFGSFSRKRYRFAGKERDEESGLCYHGARFLAPALARWVSCDPAGTVDHLNPYQFVNLNPLRAVDVDGRAATDVDQSRARVIEWSARGAEQSTRSFQQSNFERHLESLQPRPPPPAPSTPARSPTRSLAPGKLPVYGPELPDDFFRSGGLPLGGFDDPTFSGPTLPKTGSRTGVRVGGVLDIIGLLNEWHARDQAFKEFDKDWRKFWVNRWYGQSIRVIPGRTAGTVAGVEGQNSGFEAARPGKPSPYAGRFLYVDELIARADNASELEQIRTFLVDSHHAWKTNRPEHIAKGGISILTFDRATPLGDEELNGFLWHLDIKLHLIQTNQLSAPSPAGDYPLPSAVMGGAAAA